MPKPISYVRLGKSGLKISKIILGCMSYGDTRWNKWVIEDEEEVIRHIKIAYDAGIQTFDTANIYSNGASEVLLGKAIKKLNLPRDEIVVMTKVYSVTGREPDVNFYASGLNPDDEGYINQHGLSRKHIFESVKHSLERLQLDYVDLLQCHRFDNETPIEETMQALHDVVQAGYVRYTGMSTCYAWQFHAMQNYAIANKLTPFISMQNQYSLIYREEEREMMPTLKYFGVGSIPWSPLGRGLLARSLAQRKETTRGQTDGILPMYDGRQGTDEIVNRVEEVAKKRGISMAQVAVAWTLSKEVVSAPIVGTTSIKNLEDIIAGANVVLTPDEIKYLEEPYKPQSTIGHA
ncbi:hypothetical protein AGABI1DRAFT_132125 [Agaricus bisporus var. burnettii JB137-S8]|uniref:NADP-dependent oxidoreductase domain-containing protein n=1 Tax=Agaricus bisporus var. burnettii (strain JB137-S8 / ATCC MYA-4627 / FGSC 10392) TaxID=597362 RepID=K5WYD6_AGABU|nr:uncharacterized protein AGABI1DRAFT_132125 [Agaricus bisporus var. burnettii JB137-S8]EKM75587.1 hypothetical protein AGABI1DRAFT_132125 [Agaricus bisporus var. burnettii JB137-S8]